MENTFIFEGIMFVLSSFFALEFSPKDLNPLRVDIINHLGASLEKLLHQIKIDNSKIKVFSIRFELNIIS